MKRTSTRKAVGRDPNAVAAKRRDFATVTCRCGHDVLDHGDPSRAKGRPCDLCGCARWDGNKEENRG